MLIPYLLSKIEGLSGGALGVAAVVIIALLILIPFGIIWGVNILVDVQNPYDFQHWLAAFVLMLIFGSGGRTQSKS